MGYGYHWEHVIRPRIIERDRFCQRCKRLLRKLQVAHLVIPFGQPGHDADENLAALCEECHRAYDYAEWARKSKEKRCKRKDPQRPILAAVLEVPMDELSVLLSKRSKALAELEAPARAALHQMQDAGMKNGAGPLAEAIFKLDAVTSDPHKYIEENPQKAIESLISHMEKEHGKGPG